MVRLEKGLENLSSQCHGLAAWLNYSVYILIPEQWQIRGNGDEPPLGGLNLSELVHFVILSINLLFIV